MAAQFKGRKNALKRAKANFTAEEAKGQPDCVDTEEFYEKVR